MEVIERVFLLQRVDVFSDTPSHHVARIALLAKEVEADAGALLLRGTEKADAMYVVIDGELRGERPGRSTRSVGAGEAVGALAILDDAPIGLDVRVVRKSRLLRLTRRDFRDLLQDHPDLAVSLLRGMDEFAQSRFQLEARYRHVLVDEFQDTSGVQWALVSELVRSWGEGMGAADDAIAPSIFIVGDRKQSIYGFRDADVGLIDEAASFIEALRGEGDPRRAITVSFRAEPALLAFVNDLFDSIEKAENREDSFRYDERDRVPLENSKNLANPENPANLENPENLENAENLENL